MCGIAGLWELGARSSPDTLRAVAAAMADAVAHRGPDGRGLWADDGAGVALAHLRLAIIDLSPAGAQPMHSADGRLVLTFNGEIYNYRELRRELEGLGVGFRGQSDTEVLLEACALWGVERATARLNGMFAFALFDRAERRLTLARDHIGIKPLYYGWAGRTLLFGSELKALRAHPAFAPELDRDAAADFFRYAYIPSPSTIYRGVHKLPPGSLATIDAGGHVVVSAYWSMAEAATRGLAERRPMSDGEAVDELERILADAVERQMVADVPLGVLLSGGVDSSTVAALAQSRSPRRVRSFAIGFDVEGYDEAKHAAAVARHIGTEHVELTVDARTALDVIPRLPQMYDEPFADPSQIPTHLVSALTRKHVTVVLSGDGGDELFAGYDRYFHARRLALAPALIPGPARRAAAAVLSGAPAGLLDAASAGLPAGLRLGRLGTKLRKAGALIADGDRDAIYHRLMSHWPGAENPVLGAAPRAEPPWRVPDAVEDFTERMQFADAVSYLPDGVLAKVDRASMAVALEVRVPLLDVAVVEFAWRLAPDLRVRRGAGKWALRQVLHRHVPPALVERPKMGFGVPLGAWLRGPLRDWAEDLFAERALREGGTLDAPLVRRRWAEHLAGTADWSQSLWTVAMFEGWRRAWAAPSRRPAAAVA